MGCTEASCITLIDDSNLHTFTAFETPVGETGCAKETMQAAARVARGAIIHCTVCVRDDRLLSPVWEY